MNIMKNNKIKLTTTAVCFLALAAALNLVGGDCPFPATAYLPGQHRNDACSYPARSHLRHASRTGQWTCQWLYQ